ncbi:aminodeoxychorismate lyase [Aestuariibacter salexigens]|uniref:aminodeoxychorismate lyase n=1 Tax=Aestuariibacter salexigens TaxID=226010 RepID=UPI00040EA7FD|nr:aminodeoxychorismate lyase [Aestuariibacter salexigens]
MTHITQFNSAISTANRAFNYGDGCFTTIAVVNGKARLIERHMSRLQHDADKLGLKVDAWNEINEEVGKRAAELSYGVLKVLISRGEGGRGYAPDETETPEVWISEHSMPVHYAQWRQHGIMLGVSGVHLSKQPLLAGIKHLNRLEQVLVKQASVGSDCQEHVVCCEQGFMLECSASNLFWRTKGVWYTPDLASNGVNGIMRDVLLARFANHGAIVSHIQAKPEALIEAEVVFICNALMDMVPVRQFQIADVCTEYNLATFETLRSTMLCDKDTP